MTHEQYYAAVSEIESYTDRDAYVSDLALSSIFSGESDLSALSSELAIIWDVYHTDVRELRRITGLTRVAFAHRFLVPVRSVQNWEDKPGANHRECPIYTRMMIADSLGLLPERTDA